jgi:hypothetical protein
MTFCALFLPSVQAQALYPYSAIEEDELNLEEYDYLLIEPNRFNQTGFVYAEKGVEAGYVADNYIKIMGSFLRPVEVLFLPFFSISPIF